MRNLVSSTLHGGCLLAVLATAGLWVRSHSVTDSYSWPVRAEGRGLERVCSRYLETSPGRLVFGERTALM